MITFDENQPYMFVSYSHSDTNKVLPILQLLVDEGYNLWYDDKIEVASNWVEYIGDRLINSKLLMAFISNHFNEATYCYKEINFAVQNKIPILWIEIEKVNLSNGLKLQLADQQGIPYNKYADHESLIQKINESNIASQCKIEQSQINKNIINKTHNKPKPDKNNKKTSNGTSTYKSITNQIKSFSLPNNIKNAILSILHFIKMYFYTVTFIACVMMVFFTMVDVDHMSATFKNILMYIICAIFALALNILPLNFRLKEKFLSKHNQIITLAFLSIECVMFLLRLNLIFVLPESFITGILINNSYYFTNLIFGTFYAVVFPLINYGLYQLFFSKRK